MPDAPHPPPPLPREIAWQRTKQNLDIIGGILFYARYLILFYWYLLLSNTMYTNGNAVIKLL